MATKLASGFVELTVQYGSGMKKLSQDLTGVQTQAGKSGLAAGKQFTSGMERGASGAPGVMKKMFATVGKLAAPLAAGAAIGKTVMDGFRSAIDQGTAERALSGLYGSAERAADMMGQLRDISSRSPIDGSAFRDAATSLAYAGVEGEKATRILDNVGLAITAIGGGAQNMDSMTNSITKMVNAGKVQLDSLQQLSGAGVPIISGLAEHFGVSMEEINKMASDGAIGLEDVLSVMENATGENFAKALESGTETAKSFGNQMKILGDNLGEALGRGLAPLLESLAPHIGALGSVLAGVIDGAVSAFGTLSSAVSSTVGWFQENKDVAAALGIVLLPMLATMAASWALNTARLVTYAALHKGLVVATKAWTAAQWLLNAALNANPIGLIVMAIAALVAGIVLAYNRSETFRNVVQAAWEGIKTAFSAAWSVIKTVIDALGAGINWLWQSVIQPAFQRMILPIRVWWAAAQIVFKLAQAAVKAVGEVFLWLWRNAVQPAWEGIKSAIERVWQWVQPVWEGFKIALSTVGQTVMDLWQTHFVPAWEGIKNAVSTAWDFIKDIFDRFKSGFDTLKTGVVAAANAIRDGITSAFSGLADIIKAPLRALGRFLQGIPSSVMGIDIPGASTLKSWGDNLAGLKRGGAIRDPSGRLRGPGTGLSDSIVGVNADGVPIVRVSDGEGVVKKSAMDRGGSALVAALNAGWTPSPEFLHAMIPGFNTGGVVGQRRKKNDWLTALGIDPSKPLGPGKAPEGGLQRNTVALNRVISQLFPEVNTIGGYRQDALKWHPSGLALDVMIPGGTTRGGRNKSGKELGDRIWRFVQDHGGELGVDIGTSLWQTDAGGDHYDHLHLTTTGGGRPGDDDQFFLPQSLQQQIRDAQKAQQPATVDASPATAGDPLSDTTRTEGYMPSGAGRSGKVGNSLFSSFLGMGADVINGLIDQAASAASTAAAAGVAGGTMGAGAPASPAAAAATDAAIGIGTDAAKRGVQWGFDMAGIGIDAFAEIINPFGMPRMWSTDPMDFVPNFATTPAAVTTTEQAQTGHEGTGAAPGPVQPEQPPYMTAPSLQDEWGSMTATPANLATAEVDPMSMGGNQDFSTHIHNPTFRDANELDRQLADRRRLETMRYAGRPTNG